MPRASPTPEQEGLQAQLGKGEGGEGQLLGQRENARLLQLLILGFCFLGLLTLFYSHLFFLFPTPTLKVIIIIIFLLLCLPFSLPLGVVCLTKPSLL